MGTSPLRDLGYKPSDILQANCVIWVEGPSDRIYINHWIKSKASDLIEGLHYIIMFYGGSILAHVSYDAVSAENDVEDFVRLACLNRNACIVLDSDSKLVDDELSATKRRVIGEFKQNSCFVWITAGRTIENYVPGDLLKQAVAKVHPRTKFEPESGAFANLTKFDDKKTFDKVAVAHRVAGEEANFLHLDLGLRIDELLDFIHQHNS
jgi:hypothetical protein